jgi:Arc/MetJ-type ribon-helix-helix transcriptional regulator
MASENVNVRVTGDLRNHLQQQIGRFGLYENASEYIRDLIRRDLKDRKAAWEWLRQELEPGLRADESQFIKVTAADVIKRNSKPKRAKP